VHGWSGSSRESRGDGGSRRRGRVSKAEKLVESESSESTPGARKVGDGAGVAGNGSSGLRTTGSKQLNDKIYSSVACPPLALSPEEGGSSAKGRPECRMPRVEIRGEGAGGLREEARESSAVYRRSSLVHRTFSLQSRVVIYGCRSLIRRIRTPLSPHVCCPSIDPIYRDGTGVRKMSLSSELFAGDPPAAYRRVRLHRLASASIADAFRSRFDLCPIAALLAAGTAPSGTHPIKIASTGATESDRIGIEN